MNRYVATDLEGTLTAGEAWRGIGNYLQAHGRALAHRLFFAAHFPGALLARSKLIDRQNFKNRWLVDQARLLKGYTAAQVEVLAEWVIENEMWRLRRQAVIDELARYHADGCTIILASGAYEPLTQAFARRLPFTRMEILCTPLEFSAGRATGKLAGAISVDAVKGERVRALIGEGVLEAAYGDTLADVPMLEASRQPVAVAPESALAELARAKGWRVLI